MHPWLGTWTDLFASTLHFEGLMLSEQGWGRYCGHACGYVCIYLFLLWQGPSSLLSPGDINLLVKVKA